MSRTRGLLAASALWVGGSLGPIGYPVGDVSAQRAADASPELIQAILRNVYRFEGGNVRLLNGRAPDDVANFYVPPGTRVLGSVVSGSSVRIFATTTLSVDSLRTLYTSALAPAGWRPFSWGTRGGFVDSRRDQPIIFCRDGAQLQVHRQPGTAGAHDLVLDYRDGMGPCQRPGGAAAGMITSSATVSGGLQPGYFSEPEFPTLHAPDDAGGPARSRCFPAGRYRGTMGTSTFVATAMTAAELLSHYARQLEAAGWRPASGSGRQAAVGTWTRADTSGARDVTLQVTESSRTAPGCFDVQMRIGERPQ